MQKSIEKNIEVMVKKLERIWKLTKMVSAVEKDKIHVGKAVQETLLVSITIGTGVNNCEMSKSNTLAPIFGQRCLCMPSVIPESDLVFLSHSAIGNIPNKAGLLLDCIPWPFEVGVADGRPSVLRGPSVFGRDKSSPKLIALGYVATNPFGEKSTVSVLYVPNARPPSMIGSCVRFQLMRCGFPLVLGPSHKKSLNTLSILSDALPEILKRER